MNIKITQSAIDKINSLAKEKNLTEYFFRLGVRSGGCMGLEQYFDFVFIKNEDDYLQESGGIKFIVDKKSQIFLNDMEFDWKSSLMEKKFVFNLIGNNKHCSCGSSFSY